MCDLIVDQGHGLMLLPAPEDCSVQLNHTVSGPYSTWLGVPWEVDARQTLDVISTLKLDWFIVDHYALDARWESTISNGANRIMVIDDLANRSHDCALLLDQNLGRVGSDYDGLLPEECQRLIGPDFALLRPKFAALRKKSLELRKDSGLNRILISLGGVDRTNVTARVLEAFAMSTLPASIELDIILGASSPFLDDIRNQAKQLPFKAMVSVNVSDMAERMCLADLSIGAAGSTSWERVCLGLPAVLIVLAKNQIIGAEALEKAGAAMKISDAELVVKKLPPILRYLLNSSRLKQMSKAAENITNGYGALKVARTIELRGI